MKRLILVLAAVVLGACSSVSAPTAPAKPAISKTVGDACTTADGRSGYMITSGFTETCQASN